MKPRWLRSGSESLRRHMDVIAADNPSAAARARRRVRNSVIRLCQFPQPGRAGWVPGTRELVVAGIPYLVVYRVNGEYVEILRVFHTAMDRPPLGH